MGKYDIGSLNREFQAVQLDFTQLHSDMNFYLDAYENNVFYRPKANMPVNSSIGVNLLQVFADKNWFYLSPFPKTVVPPNNQDRQGANIREKILLGTHDYNSMDLMWSKLTHDGTILSLAATDTRFNFDTRCVHVRRFDPRRVYWQKSDANDEGIDVFWTATAMTREAIRRKYGVTPTGDSGMTYEDIMENSSIPMDGKDYFLVIERNDANVTVVWAGNTLLVEPYNHQLGVIPNDLAMPLRLANFDHKPDFYLRRLKHLQAEFNELFRQRANIVRKLGNPVVWARGVGVNNKSKIEEALQTDGGFVGLNERGELKLLSIPETQMIDTALNDVFQRMKDVAGFPTATFGEVVGANTSGDALGMYFTPTQRAIDHQNIAYKSMLKSINSKILRGYNKFLKTGEVKSLDGYTANGMMMEAGEGQLQYQSGGAFTVQFTKDMCSNYYNVINTNSVTPKDDIAYKTLIFQMIQAGAISKVRGYEELGFLSPEDELQMLENEARMPYLNPEGVAKIHDMLNPQVPATTKQAA